MWSLEKRKPLKLFRLELNEYANLHDKFSFDHIDNYLIEIN